MEGIDDLFRNLNSINGKAYTFMESGLNAAADIVVDDAKKRVRLVTLRNAITKTRVSGLDSKKSIYLGVPKSNGIDYDPKWIEFGTGKHDIKIFVRNRQTGKYHAKILHHPGSKAEPFLYPALMANKQRAVDAVADELRQGLGL